MRNDIDVDTFRQRLLETRDRLRELSGAAQDARDTVELDQARTGHLARMDALQQQAMAQAERQRAAVMVQRVDAALKRMDSDDFGYCLDCGEAIATGRLDADPTAALCVRCAETRERR